LVLKRESKYRAKINEALFWFPTIARYLLTLVEIKYREFNVTTSELQKIFSFNKEVKIRDPFSG
jgi:hypothetical protein